MRRTLLLVAAAVLFPTPARAAVTYSFDWYCSGCAKIGMGSNGKEGPYGSGAACEGARASLSGSPRDARLRSALLQPAALHFHGPAGCSACAASGVRAIEVGAAARGRAVLRSPRRSGAARADEVKPAKGAAEPREISGKWRNSFSWYEVRAARDAVEIVLVETCRIPDCVRREYPNRPVFRGRFEGRRLVGVVPIRTALESEQNGRHCATPVGEFPAEGSVSEDGSAIAWKAVQIPVGEGCAPVGISLGTWRRG